MNTYCSMIHGGLWLNIEPQRTQVKHCALYQHSFDVDHRIPFWQDSRFQTLREKNKTNQWDTGCYNCQHMEAAGLTSFRQGMNTAFTQDLTEISGPVRMDLRFNLTCNLACRTCGPWASTLWQKQYKTLGKEYFAHAGPGADQAILALEQLDLSNLRQIVLGGGEPLLGTEYWKVVEWLADNVPNAKNQLTVGLLTNGTHDIDPKYHRIIEKLFLMKIHFSIDAVGDRFHYMRWPAEWHQVSENMINLKNSLPSNVMFLIEETISIFNLFYLDELEQWLASNFNQDAWGRTIEHSRHIAGGSFKLTNCSQSYKDHINSTKYKYILPQTQENLQEIKQMLTTIREIDQLRNQSFEQTFPEVANFYKGLLNER